MMHTIANKHVSDGFALNIAGYLRVRGVVVRYAAFFDMAGAITTSKEHPYGTFECSRCRMMKRLSSTEMARFNDDFELMCEDCSDQSCRLFIRLSDDTALPGRDSYTFTELMAAVRSTECTRLTGLLTCIIKNKAAKVIQVHARIFLARRAAATRRNLRMVLPVLIKRESLPKDVLLLVRDMCLGKSM